MVITVLLSSLLMGCAGVGVGVSQEQYEGVAAQLRDTQAQVTELQGDIKDLQAEKAEVNAQLQAAQAEAAALQGQVGGLKEQYELVGATPAETAEKIVKYYHETHVYSIYDLFVCSDMAIEIWNMLKAQGINSVIAVGNIDTPITDIILCNHAWVLAEVSPGEYLALETTGGFAAPRSQNALYYSGWFFASPKELKSYNQLIREYNVRVDIRNQTAAEINEAIEEHNRATNQQTADKLMAVYERLKELLEDQEAQMNNLNIEIERLATEIR